MSIGVAGIELAAKAQGLLPVLAKLRVQAAEESERTVALAARPSEVVPQELHFHWASTTYVGPEGVHDETHDN